MKTTNSCFYLIASFSCLLSQVTMSRNSMVWNIIEVTEIHSLYKFRAISCKTRSSYRGLCSKASFSCWRLTSTYFKTVRGVSFKSATKTFLVIQDPSNTTRWLNCSLTFPRDYTCSQTKCKIFSLFLPCKTSIHQSGYHDWSFASFSFTSFIEHWTWSN